MKKLSIFKANGFNLFTFAFTIPVALFFFCSIVHAQTWDPQPLLTSAQDEDDLTGGEANQWVKKLEIAPSNADIAWAGVDTSGVWKCENAGSTTPTWEHKSVGMYAMGISGIAISPINPDIVCIATKRYTSSVLGMTYSTGIYRTTDGGDNWALQKNISTGYNTDKSGDIIIWTGTSTDLYCGSMGNGLFKSADSGDTWFNLRDASGTDTFSGKFVVDVKPHPANSNVLYVCLTSQGTTSAGLHKVTTNGSITVSTRSYLLASAGATKSFIVGTGTIYIQVALGSSKGIKKSTDDGVTFTDVSGGISSLQTYELGHFEVSSINHNMAVITQGTRTTNASYWYTNNLGSVTTWTNPTAMDTQNGVGWVSGSVVTGNQNTANGARPTAFSPNYWLCGTLYSILSKSTNNGQTWSYACSGYQGVTRGDSPVLNQSSYFAWDKINANRYIVGGADYGARYTTDGIIFKPLYNYLSSVNNRRDVLCAALEPGGSVAIVAVGQSGTQNLQRTTDIEAATPVFAVVNSTTRGYDGIFFNGSDTNIVYAGSQKSSDKGATWAAMTSSYKVSAVHPTNGNLIYYAQYTGSGAKIWRSSDAGVTWTNPFAVLAPIPASGTFGEFTVDPNDINRCYLGTRGDGIYIIVTDSVTLVTSGLEDSIITTNTKYDYVNLCVDPFDNNILYTAANSNYAGVQSQGIFKSTDKGVTWTDWNYNLSPANFSAISINPVNRQCYANSFSGTFILSEPLQAGTPTVTTGTATSVVDTTATLNGTVDPNNGTTTYRWQRNTGSESWGTATNTGSTTITGDTATAVSTSTTGLSPSTTYFVRLQASNSIASVSGSQTTFTTSASVAPPTAGTDTVNINEDTYIRADATTSNYGTDTVATLRYGSLGFSWHVLMEADIGNPGSVTSAKLNFWGYQSDSNSITWRVYGVNAGSWTANTVTWATKPATSTTSIATFAGTDTTTRWRTVDVTNYVQTLGSSTISLYIAPPATSSTNTKLHIGTGESTTTPYLLISYDDPIDSTAPVGTITINGNATYTVSHTATLNLTATDVIGVTGYYLASTSTTPGIGDAGWVTVGTSAAYSADVSYALPAPDGTKTVNVWFKDGSGNLGTITSDTIVMDTINPSITINSLQTNYTLGTVTNCLGTTAATIALSGSSTDTNNIGTVTVSNSATTTVRTVTGTSTWSSTERILPFMDAGLVLYARLDETNGTFRRDSSAYASHGTATGSIGSTTSRYGNAGYFDGVDDSDNFGDPTDGHLDFGTTTSISYSCWIYPTAYAGSWDSPIWKGGSSAGNKGFDMELGSGAWTLNISQGTGTTKGVTLLADSSAYLNKWTFVTGIVDRDSQNLKGYINGVQVGTTSISVGSGTLASSNSLKIGLGDTSLWFKGNIDEVRIYGYALTNQEVLNLYNATSPDILNTFSATATGNDGNQGTETVSIGAFPAVVTDLATSITQHTAQLNGNCNANNNTSTVWFDYGDISGYYTGSSSVATITGNSDTAVAIALGSLIRGQTYYYRLCGSNTVGIIQGVEYNFTTGAGAVTNGQYNNMDMTYPGSTRFNMYLKSLGIYPGIFWARNYSTKDGIDLRVDPDTVISNFMEE